jgi:hypothetical protein
MTSVAIQQSFLLLSITDLRITRRAEHVGNIRKIKLEYNILVAARQTIGFS